MVRGIVIPAVADEALEEREFAELEDYQAAVGGWIEAVDLPGLGVTIYVNEEGLLRHLPFNSRATFLWWYHFPEARQEPMLAGDVVLVGSPDQSGSATDISDAMRELLLGPTVYRIEVRTDANPGWHANQTIYPDYWEAVIWAVLLPEQHHSIEEARILPTPTPTTPM